MNLLADENCTCSILTNGNIFICPMHYGRYLEDSSIDYGLETDSKTAKELSKKLGITIVIAD